MDNEKRDKGFRSPVTIAMYEGICAICKGKIKRGEEIIKREGNVWNHARCVNDHRYK